ncbi:vanadium-dependent haloperoxidase [Thalassotalea psychrophila]|uniref:Vanadium-dependent haloperoxidase n=1 Tax=Thalassotalea psychrophila TaxID=3065647 RepID=A0ABY9TVE5_9GAMM|nr:vanadium-dependent haloperoxidase [Colwelliaceae bacterium SQ149]
MNNNLIKLSSSALLILAIAACNDSSDNTTIEEQNITERAGHSVARQWNEVILHGIRNDYARPTVHARNLFHTSSAMFDAWATFDESATPFLYNNSVAGFSCSAQTINTDNNYLENQEEAISYAAYRLVEHRFRNSPGVHSIMEKADGLMSNLGYDINDTTENSVAALGNHIADCYIQFGFQDGANEQLGYANTAYQPVNAPLELGLNRPGNPNITDLDHWQPLSIEGYIDQAGNPVDSIPEFLGPEWGQVIPFALSENDKTTYPRDDFDYQVYFDPGMPPTIEGDLSEEYKWGFSLVAVWSAHLGKNNDEVWDISPNSLGNISSYPELFKDYPQFYNQLNGGDSSSGYKTNPVTNQPYEEQLVPRSDYARVLAEFWADGPESETPPGHWFVILNTVSDHSLLEKRWQGEGDLLGNLEWDIKTYFAMGGTMHDSAITAWGIKGHYDYIRPVSAIRAMADLGQSTNENLPSFHINGLPLIDNYIELVSANDPLVGEDNEHLGKIKVLSWKGPEYIDNPDSDLADVDWILAENWWPYQRPSFVTPPFAGYVSGHSTYSRAAADLMTAMTGDSYFPGGMSEFSIKADEFLVFEQGPSIDMTLQWATYKDASDQCSLSRIWGGIHPPADDLPGRVIGAKIGKQSFEFAQSFFN